MMSHGRKSSLSALASHLILPDGIVSTGWGRVRAQCAKMGIQFDPWQDGLGKAMLAKRANGQYAAGVGGVCMSLPRQVGKTFTVGNMVLGLCLTSSGLKAIWTAHRTRTSAETFRTMQAMVKAPKVAPFIRGVRRANGQEEIVFSNGSRIMFGARESGFGRGFDAIDLLVFDEAQILTQKPLDDMLATMNAAPNGLAVFLGTPPKPSDPSEVFSRLRREALSGKEPNCLYVEFSAGDDPTKIRLDDRKAWARANPSYPARTSETAMLRLLTQLGEESFRREGLGMWDPEALTTAAIPAHVWQDTLVDAVPLEKSRVCFAARFSPDGALVALGAAGRTGKGQFFIDGLRIEPTSSGIGWLTDFLTDTVRRDTIAQIVIDGKAGAGYLIDRLRGENIPARVLMSPSTSDVVDAHGMFLAALTEKKIAHAPNGELDRQAALATRRKIGTLGGFGWAAPAGDTSVLLDAVTLAFWACATTKRNPKPVKDGQKNKKVVIL